MMTLPDTSCRVAPAGTLTLEAGPIAEMVVPSITRTPSEMTSPVMGMSSAPTKA